ncbi:glycosyltransferase family 4 protein [Halomarina oriensis]|uniref:Glycosyltransferase n=1 Tax=Halomarina oriensis TaxID=671145 RepID=A0A6B0GH69_9EURY|nr:glycosyltransferase family 4 protein [Halomarina oriensis]MWG34222.1 glycosyltransferase [Halomarina oriensis]
MHVGLVVPGSLDTVSGGYCYDRRLVSHLHEAGDRVTVVSLPTGGYRRRVVDSLRPRLRRALARPFDVLVEDELAHPSLVGVAPDVPRVALVHLLRGADPSDPHRRSARLLERRYLGHVDHVVATSDATRRAVTDLADRPTSVVPPAGDRFAPTSVDAAAIRRRAHEGPLRVATLGSVVPRKGLDTLVAALARLDTDWRLTAMGDTTGDPAFVRAVRQSAARRGVSDRVTLTGRVEDGTVAGHLRRAHVFALPSRYEPFGIAALEAMGFGLPALATTAGGPPEFVTDGADGFLVDPDDPESLAARLDTLATDRERLARMGVVARGTFETAPSWDDRMATFRTVLERVAAGDTPPRDRPAEEVSP